MNEDGLHGIGDRLAALETYGVGTWQDLSTILEGLKGRHIDAHPPQNTPTPAEFKKKVSQSLAILSHRLAPDSLGNELLKTSWALRTVLSQSTGADPHIHWIAGRILPHTPHVKEPRSSYLQIPGFGGPEGSLDPYFQLFRTRLERNHEAYRLLPKVIWKSALQLAARLGSYLEEVQTRLLIAADVGSLPLDISTTLATVLVAELARLPVICLNGSFFWEQTCSAESTSPTVRYNRNAHLPEVFSVLETLFPWDSPMWIHANASESQSRYIREAMGVNPARVHTLPTVVNTEEFHPDKHQDSAFIFHRINQLLVSNGLSSGMQPIETFNPATHLSRSPLLLGTKKAPHPEIDAHSLVLLQPTRIVHTRRIEKDLDIILEMSRCEALREALKKDAVSNVVLLITGRIGLGCELYFEEVVAKARKTLSTMPEEVSARFFIGFLFGGLVSDSPHENVAPKDVSLSEIYAIASLVMLPSETEGRALPLMEAAAGGAAILTSRFSPETVYRRIVGSPDDPTRQLKILSIRPGDDKSTAEAVVDLLLDKGRREAHRSHNLLVAKEKFSRNILVPAWSQLLSDTWILSEYRNKANGHARTAIELLLSSSSEKSWKAATHTQTRRYIPGYWPLGYVNTIKGLMVPSGYLCQERELRARLFKFAFDLVRYHPVERRALVHYMMATESLLTLSGGETENLSDHSLAYRRRDFQKRLHEDLTEQGLMGAAGQLVREIFGDEFDARRCNQSECWEICRHLWPLLSPHADTWVKRLRLLCSLGTLCEEDGLSSHPSDLSEKVVASMSQLLAIDDVSLFLQEVVHQPRHLLHFTGSWKTVYFELLMLGQHLLEHWRAVTARTDQPYSVTFAARRRPLGEEATASDLHALLETELFAPLKTASESGLFKIISTECSSMGTDLSQVGEEVLARLAHLRKEDGVVTASGDHNAHTLDLLDLPCFRFGTITQGPAGHAAGIPKGSSYIQFVPQRIRPTLGHPVPVQTSRDLSSLLHSTDFRALSRMEGGARRVWGLMESHAELTAAPSQHMVDAHLSSQRPLTGQKQVPVEELCGLHDDGQPFTACMARLEPAALGPPLAFVLQKARRSGESVLDIARRYVGETGQNVAAAWNGGYIINRHVMQKNNFPKEVLGSPLGLMMIGGKVLSPPLFSRPVLSFDTNGRPHIARLTLDFPGSICTNNPSAPQIAWQKNAINPEVPPHDDPAVYTLNYEKGSIPIEDRALLVLCGNRVAQILLPEDGLDVVPMQPMGLHVSVPLDRYYDELSDTYFEGTEVQFDFAWSTFWQDMVDAVEAGPLLLRNNRIAIDLLTEGWKTKNSKLTQAGRLDLETLRGPKLGVGLTRNGVILLLAVNGRIRDSVGATYRELALLLKEQGAFSAMCFDPGGSVTLVTQGQVRNIPPHNEDVENNPYVSPPEPRPVGGAVLAAYPRQKERK